MVFILKVPLSVMTAFISDVKEKFLVLNESDSFINIKFSLLNPRSLVLFSFRLYLLVDRASCDGLSLNFTIMSPFFVQCNTLILGFLILWMSFGTSCTQYRCSSHLAPRVFQGFQAFSLLPYYSSWFLLIFSSSNSSWALFSVLLMRVFSFFRFLFSASILAIWLLWVSSVSAWKSCHFSISMNFFSMLSILVARLSPCCCMICSYSILFSVPSVDDVILVRVAIISFKVSSCCYCTSASWLFRFIILFWFCSAAIFFLFNNGYYWICISVKVKFTDFH